MTPVAVPETVARAGGRVLEAGIGVLAVRRDKPLHPHGIQFVGALERYGSGETDGPWGVPWIDEPGRDEITVRLSRGAGLPGPLPDVLGLAIRVLRPEGPADLLFSTTGSAPLLRFLLLPRRDWCTTYTTLFPYRTPRGSALLAAHMDCGEDGGSLTLCIASLLGSWHAFAAGPLIPLDAVAPSDPPISFDPVRNQIEGMPMHPSAARLREPSYARARRMRSA